MNRLFQGDNLDVLRQHIGTDSVDLIYLDPPFNSDRSSDELFRSHEGVDSQAQIEAFDDVWHWSPHAAQVYRELITGAAPIKVAGAIEAMRKLLGTSDVLAYLVMMTARLGELHRVLKPTGTLYLHCDPTASHYVKVILDAVFGPERFLSEIIWKRPREHNRGTCFGPVHDVILAYAKGDTWTWNPQYMHDPEFVERDYRRIEHPSLRRYRLSDVISSRPGSRYEWKGTLPPDNRYWAYPQETMQEFEDAGKLAYSADGYPQLKKYLDEMPGQPVLDVWTDVQPINKGAAERLGYPTQKPLALLERIILAHSNEGDVVLDPFGGCGTTIDAAQKLNRQWIGIDVTDLAVDVVQKRLRDTYGDEVAATYEVRRVPTGEQ